VARMIRAGGDYGHGIWGHTGHLLRVSYLTRSAAYLALAAALAQE